MAGPVSIYTDGASRGNPGPAAIAYQIRGDGVLPVDFSETIGQTTNNVAEYRAVIGALTTAKRLGAGRVRLHSDSELIVKQMRGEYRVKHPDIKPLHSEVTELVAEFDDVEFVYVPRAENVEADRLCNEALNGRPTALGWLPKAAAPEPVAARPANRDADVIEFLESVRHEWTSQKGEGRSAVAIWEELKALLQKKKLLKPPPKK